MTLEELKRAKICPPSLTSSPYPNFGFYPENNGDKTLGEWAEENSVDLSADLATIDEKPRYGYGSEEIGRIKRRALSGWSGIKYQALIKEEDLAILERTLPAYFLSQFRKLNAKVGLSEQTYIAYLRIIFRKIIRSRIISDEMILGQMRRFVDSGSSLSVINLVTYHLREMVAEENTKAKES